MNWTLNSIRIFVTNKQVVENQILARLFPYNSATVIQFFGYEDSVLNLTAKVVGSTDLNSLVALKSTGLTYALNSPFGSLGNYYVKSITYDYDKPGKQTIRQDLDVYTQVYTCKIELFPE